MDYSKIFDPKSKKIVKVDSKAGQQVLKSYIDQVGGMGAIAEDVVEDEDMVDFLAGIKPRMTNERAAQLSSRPVKAKAPKKSNASACVGLTREKCNPPDCQFINGPKRQYCKKTSGKDVVFTNPANPKPRGRPAGGKNRPRAVGSTNRDPYGRMETRPKKLTQAETNEFEGLASLGYGGARMPVSRQYAW